MRASALTLYSLHLSNVLAVTPTDLLERIIKGLILHNTWNLVPTPTKFGSIRTVKDTHVCFENKSTVLETVSKQRLLNGWMTVPFSPSLDCYVDISGNCLSPPVSSGIPDCDSSDSSSLPPDGFVSETKLAEMYLGNQIDILDLNAILEREFGALDPSTVPCVNESNMTSIGKAISVESWLALNNVSSNRCDALIPLADIELTLITSESTACMTKTVDSSKTFLRSNLSVTIETPFLPDRCLFASNLLALEDFSNGVLQINRTISFPPMKTSVEFAYTPPDASTCQPLRGNSRDCTLLDMWSCDSVEGCYVDWESSVCADNLPGFFSTSMSAFSPCNPIPDDQRYIGLGWTSPDCPSACKSSAEYLVDGVCVPIPQTGWYVGPCDDDLSLHACTENVALVDFPYPGSCEGGSYKHILVGNPTNKFAIWIKASGVPVTLFGEIDKWNLAVTADHQIMFTNRTSGSTLNSLTNESFATDEWMFVIFDDGKVFLSGNRVQFASSVDIGSDPASMMFYGPSQPSPAFEILGPFQITANVDSEASAMELFQVIESPSTTACERACTRPALRIYIETSTSTTTEGTFTSTTESQSTVMTQSAFPTESEFLSTTEQPSTTSEEPASVTTDEPVVTSSSSADLRSSFDTPSSTSESAAEVSSEGVAETKTEETSSWTTHDNLSLTTSASAESSVSYSSTTTDDPSTDHGTDTTEAYLHRTFEMAISTTEQATTTLSTKLTELSTEDLGSTTNEQLLESYSLIEATTHNLSSTTEATSDTSWTTRSDASPVPFSAISDSDSTTVTNTHDTYDASTLTEIYRTISSTGPPILTTTESLTEETETSTDSHEETPNAPEDGMTSTDSTSSASDVTTSTDDATTNIQETIQSYDSSTLAPTLTEIMSVPEISTQIPASEPESTSWLPSVTSTDIIFTTTTSDPTPTGPIQSIQPNEFSVDPDESMRRSTTTETTPRSSAIEWTSTFTSLTEQPTTPVFTPIINNLSTTLDPLDYTTLATPLPAMSTPLLTTTTFPATESTTTLTPPRRTTESEQDSDNRPIHADPTTSTFYSRSPSEKSSVSKWIAISSVAVGLVVVLLIASSCLTSMSRRRMTHRIQQIIHVGP